MVGATVVILIDAVSSSSISCEGHAVLRAGLKAIPVHILVVASVSDNSCPEEAQGSE
jgi:hypothetical protein